jgi:hypothetical protein
MSSFLLAEQLLRLQGQADKVGVDMRFVVEPSMLTGDLQIERGADKEVFGASVGELAVAHAAIELLDPEQRIIISRYVEGAGRYDTERAVGMQVSAVDLQRDMLQRSGNASFAMLADEIGGAEVLNDFYDSKGWEKTRVTSNTDGKTLLGNTTALEALDQLEKLVEGRDAGIMEAASVEALRESEVAPGNVRAVIRSYRKLNIINKHGSYSGDKADPYEFRHDVGVIGTDTERIGYAVMTRSPMSLKGSMAILAVQQFGVELSRALGAKDSLKIGPRVLGSLRRRV